MSVPYLLSNMFIIYVLFFKFFLIFAIKIALDADMK